MGELSIQRSPSVQDCFKSVCRYVSVFSLCYVRSSVYGPWTVLEPCRWTWLMSGARSGNGGWVTNGGATRGAGCFVRPGELSGMEVWSARGVQPGEGGPLGTRGLVMGRGAGEAGGAMVGATSSWVGGDLEVAGGIVGSASEVCCGIWWCAWTRGVGVRISDSCRVARWGTTGGFVGPGAISRGAYGTTGMYFRKNFQLCSVTRPDPSTCTTDWSNCLTLTTTPVLSHLVGSVRSDSGSWHSLRWSVVEGDGCAQRGTQQCACAGCV